MKSFDKSFDHFNLREIRKERQKIAEELSRTFNQSKYYEHRQKQ